MNDQLIGVAEAGTDDKRAIGELVDVWMAATKAGDVATVLDLVADDVIFMVPGREPFGKDEFGASLKSMRDVAMDGRSDIREIEVLGNWAWIRNHIDLTVTPKNGDGHRRSGYTLTILRKGTDNRWRLFRDANLVS